MAHDVFVSYPNVDKVTADAVVNTLESNGIRCWVAPRDVPHGVDWAGAIVEAIGLSRMLVLVFSDGTNASDHILREVRAAGDADIPIVPFRTTAAEPTPALKYYIGGTHWLDAMSGPMERHLGTLVVTVERMLSDEEPSERPKPAKPMHTMVPPSSDSWWTRLSTAARVGIVAAAIAVVGLVGLLAANSGDDGGEPIGLPDGGASSTIAVVEDVTAATEASDAPVPTSEPPASAELSSDTVPSLFGVAIWDGPSRLCELGTGTIQCVEVSPLIAERIHNGVGFGDFDEDGLTDAVFTTGVDGGTGAEWCRNLGAPLGFECSEFSDGEGLAARSGSGSGSAVEVADLDGDGHLDVVFGNSTQGRSSVERADLCLGSGTGLFECRVLSDAELDPEDVGGAAPGVNGLAIDDLDGDGVLDVVLAGWPEVEACFGGPDVSFDCATLTRDTGQGGAQDVALGDFDGDGALDLALAKTPTPSRVCFNTGSRTFECEDASEPFADIGAVGAADLDSDGTTDLLFVQHPNFDDAGDDSHVSVCFGPLQRGTRCEPTRVLGTEFLNLDSEKLVVDDLTGDGFADLLLMSAGVPISCPGSGDGSVECSMFDSDLFTDFDDGGVAIGTYPSSMAWAPRSDAFAAEIEFVIANRSGPNPLCRYEVPISVTTDPPHAQVGPECIGVDGQYASTAVAVADFNADGRPDLAFAAGLINESAPEDSPMDRVCLAADDGYDCSDLADGDIDSEAIAAGDLDGDGIVDLVVGHEFHDGVEGEPVYVRACAGDGAGGFDCTAVFVGGPIDGGPYPTVTAVELVDVDTDSDLDVIVASDIFENVLCRNDGEFEFTCAPIEPERARTHDLGVGDFDRNGSIDVYFVNQPTPNRLCLNDGAGTFACSDATGPENSSLSVGVVDVNGDGAVDVVLGRGDTNDSLGFRNKNVDQVCLGDGAGGFSCSDFENLQEFPVAMAPIPEGLLTVGSHPVLCLPDGASYFCHRMDSPDRPLMTDDRGFEIPMWHMDVALVP